MQRYRQCKECKETKLLNDQNFRLDKRNKTGYTYKCIECIKEYWKKYYQSNKEKINEDAKNYYKNNTEEGKSKRKKWYIKNRKSRIAQMKRYYYNNQEECRERFSVWARTEQGRKIMNMHSRNREKIKKHEITGKEWESCKAYFNNSCAYCGMTFEEHKEKYKQDLHKDHLIHDGRNDLKNCVPSCKICNVKKHQSSLNNWYNKVDNENYTYERYLNIVEWIKEGHKKYIKRKKRKHKDPV